MMRRRQALRLIGLAGVYGVFGRAAAASPLAASPAPAERQGAHPPDVGVKFNPDGTVRRYPGNTIVCPITENHPAFPALGTVRDRMMEASFARRLAFLPPPSYHMTVFDGVYDAVRTPGVWPDDVPVDAPLETCTQTFLRKLKFFDWDAPTPFRMRVDDVDFDFVSAPIPLVAIDKQEEEKLRGLRDRLSQLLRIRKPNHPTYRFHISQSYLFDWMTERETVEYWKVRSDALAFLRKNVPILEIRHPQFCAYKDMFAFPPLLEFSAS